MGILSKRLIAASSVASLLLIAGCNGSSNTGSASGIVISDAGSGSSAAGSGSTATVSSLAVQTTTPEANATGVAPDGTIRIKLNQSLDGSSIDGKSVYLLGQGGQVSGASTSFADDTILIQPSAPLDFSSAYTAVVSKDVKSVGGASLSEDYSFTFTTSAKETSLPLLGVWESNMVTYGQKWGSYISNNNDLNATYYDAERIYYQIGDYLGQGEPWQSYSQAAEKIYRDNYAAPNNFVVPGYWRFVNGLYYDYIKTGDLTSLNDIPLMRDNPAFSDADTSAFASNWYREEFSREVAYALLANVMAERAGFSRKTARVNAYVDMALNHLNIWVTGNYINPDPSKTRVAPFMFGLTAEALIAYYEWEVEQGRDPGEAIPNAIKSMADHLWTTATVKSGVNAGKKMWVADLGGSAGQWTDTGGTGYGAFRYEDKNSANPAPDLNLLIAPAYAWLFKHFGDTTYIQRGDLIWAGGVALAALNSAGKVFDQNYRWSIDYVKWREEGFSKL